MKTAAPGWRALVQNRDREILQFRRFVQGSEIKKDQRVVVRLPLLINRQTRKTIAQASIYTRDDSRALQFVAGFRSGLQNFTACGMITVLLVSESLILLFWMRVSRLIFQSAFFCSGCVCFEVDFSECGHSFEKFVDASFS